MILTLNRFWARRFAAVIAVVLSCHPVAAAAAGPAAATGAFLPPLVILPPTEPFFFNSFVDCNMAEV